MCWNERSGASNPRHERQPGSTRGSKPPSSLVRMNNFQIFPETVASGAAALAQNDRCGQRLSREFSAQRRRSY